MKMSKHEIKEGVHWVGAVDWDIRNFHGYATDRGSTYNSYLILDEKKVLIDTVKSYMSDALINNIENIIDIKNLDFVVVNHVEPDHSGSIEKIIALSDATIITTKKGKNHLELHYDDAKSWNYKIVDTGESISIGKRTLTFVKTPMLHWPDNMVTYSQEDKILFSNDAFGQHIATSKRYDYEIKSIMDDAKEYFANILLPYKSLIPNAVKTVKGLDIEYICPSHGGIWTKKIDDILDAYLEWSGNKLNEKAVIAYDSMYGSTHKLALSIADGLIEKGIDVKIYNISKTPMNKIIVDMIDAKYVLIGSPTLNSTVYPSVAMFLNYMEGLKMPPKIGVAFGSFGWGEAASKVIKESFNKLKFDIIEDKCLKCKFVPKKDHLNECYEFGKNLTILNIESKN